MDFLTAPFARQLRRFYSFLFKKVLGNLVQDLDGEQLQVGLLAGAVQLRDLRLNVDVLNELTVHLPFTFIRASIRHVRAKVPLLHLLRDPCQVVIEGLELVVAPSSQVHKPQVFGESSFLEDSLADLDAASLTENVRLHRKLQATFESVGGELATDLAGPLRSPSPTPDADATEPPTSPPHATSTYQQQAVDENIQVLSSFLESVLARIELQIADVSVSIEHRQVADRQRKSALTLSLAELQYGSAALGASAAPSAASADPFKPRLEYHKAVRFHGFTATLSEHAADPVAASDISATSTTSPLSPTGPCSSYIIARGDPTHESIIYAKLRMGQNTSAELPRVELDSFVHSLHAHMRPQHLMLVMDMLTEISKSSALVAEEALRRKGRGDHAMRLPQAAMARPLDDQDLDVIAGLLPNSTVDDPFTGVLDEAHRVQLSPSSSSASSSPSSSSSSDDEFFDLSDGGNADPIPSPPSSSPSPDDTFLLWTAKLTLRNCSLVLLETNDEIWVDNWALDPAALQPSDSSRPILTPPAVFNLRGDHVVCNLSSFVLDMTQSSAESIFQLNVGVAEVFEFLHQHYRPSAPQTFTERSARRVQNRCARYRILGFENDFAAGQDDQHDRLTHFRLYMRSLVQNHALKLPLPEQHAQRIGLLDEDDLPDDLFQELVQIEFYTLLLNLDVLALDRLALILAAVSGSPVPSPFEPGPHGPARFADVDRFAASANPCFDSSPDVTPGNSPSKISHAPPLTAPLQRMRTRVLASTIRVCLSFSALDVASPAAQKLSSIAEVRDTFGPAFCDSRGAMRAETLSIELCDMMATSYLDVDPIFSPTPRPGVKPPSSTSSFDIPHVANLLLDSEWILRFHEVNAFLCYPATPEQASARVPSTAARTAPASAGSLTMFVAEHTDVLMSSKCVLTAFPLLDEAAHKVIPLIVHVLLRGVPEPDSAKPTPSPDSVFHDLAARHPRHPSPPEPTAAPPTESAKSLFRSLPQLLGAVWGNDNGNDNNAGAPMQLGSDSTPQRQLEFETTALERSSIVLSLQLPSCSVNLSKVEYDTLMRLVDAATVPVPDERAKPWLSDNLTVNEEDEQPSPPSSSSSSSPSPSTSVTSDVFLDAVADLPSPTSSTSSNLDDRADLLMSVFANAISTKPAISSTPITPTSTFSFDEAMPAAPPQPLHPFLHYLALQLQVTEASVCLHESTQSFHFDLNQLQVSMVSQVEGDATTYLNVGAAGLVLREFESVVRPNSDDLLRIPALALLYSTFVPDEDKASGLVVQSHFAGDVPSPSDGDDAALDLRFAEQHARKVATICLVMESPQVTKRETLAMINLRHLTKNVALSSSYMSKLAAFFSAAPELADQPPLFDEDTTRVFLNAYHCTLDYNPPDLEGRLALQFGRMHLSTTLLLNSPIFTLHLQLLDGQAMLAAHSPSIEPTIPEPLREPSALPQSFASFWFLYARATHLSSSVVENRRRRAARHRYHPGRWTTSLPSAGLRLASMDENAALLHGLEWRNGGLIAQVETRLGLVSVATSDMIDVFHRSVDGDGSLNADDMPPSCTEIRNGRLDVLTCSDSLGTFTGVLSHFFAAIDGTPEEATEQPDDDEALELERQLRQAMATGLSTADGASSDDEAKLSSDDEYDDDDEFGVGTPASLQVIEDYLASASPMTYPARSSDTDYTPDTQWHDTPNVMDNYVPVPTVQDSSTSVMHLQDSLRDPDLEYGPVVSETRFVEVVVNWRLFGGSDWDNERGRDTSEVMELRCAGVTFRIQSFDVGTEADAGRVVSRQALAIRDIEFIDMIESSPFHKFACLFVPDPSTAIALASASAAAKQGASVSALATRMSTREVHSCMFTMELASLCPDPLKPQRLESRLRLEFLPLRFHIHQDAREFLALFFAPQEDDEPAADEPPGEVTFFQKFSTKGFPVRIDYEARSVDLQRLKHGDYTQLLNMLSVDGATVQLQPLKLHAVDGWGALIYALLSHWGDDIAHNQKRLLLGGVQPFRTLNNVGGGLRDLVVVPVSDDRVLRGVQRGSSSFAGSVAAEASSLLVSGLSRFQSLLEFAESIIDGGSAGAAGEGEAPPQVPQRRRLRRSVQPRGFHDGMRRAFSALSRGLESAARSLVVVPSEHFAQHGFTAGVGAAVRGVPKAVLRPMIGLSEAAQSSVQGLHNELNPQRLREFQDKYKSDKQS